jgi:hypothetical protein
MAYVGSLRFLSGERITVRQIRNGTELLPITQDRSYDFNYQEYRLLSEPRRVMPVSANYPFKTSSRPRSSQMLFYIYSYIYSHTIYEYTRMLKPCIVCFVHSSARNENVYTFSSYQIKNPNFYSLKFDLRTPRTA